MSDKYREKISQFTHAELVDTLVREAELRRQWERKALGIKEAPCKETDGVVRAQVVLEFGNDNKVSRRRVYDLDPRGVNLAERQQTRVVPKHASVDGVDPRGASEIERVGRPLLIAMGEIIGGSNEVLFERPPDELQVVIEKIEDNNQFIFIWDGERVAGYEVTEQALLYESFRNHLELMIDKALRGINSALGHEQRTAVTRAQVREAIGIASSIRWGMAWANSSLPSTRSSDG